MPGRSASPNASVHGARRARFPKVILAWPRLSSSSVYPRRKWDTAKTDRPSERWVGATCARGIVLQDGRSSLTELVNFHTGLSGCNCDGYILGAEDATIVRHNT